MSLDGNIVCPSGVSSKSAGEGVGARKSVGIGDVARGMGDVARGIKGVVARGREGVVDRERGGDLVLEIDRVLAFGLSLEDGVGTRLPAIGVIALGTLVGVVLRDR